MKRIYIKEKEVDVNSLTVEGIDPKDFPDFSDAFFASGKFKDGSELTEDELEELTFNEGESLSQMTHTAFCLMTSL